MLTTTSQEYSYSQVHTTHFAVEGNSIFNVLQAGRNKVLSDNPGPVRLKYGSNISCPISKPHLLYVCKSLHCRQSKYLSLLYSKYFIVSSVSIVVFVSIFDC